MRRKLRVAINAQVLPDSGMGGIETVLRVLTELSHLDGEEEYIFIGHWAEPYWLRPLLDKKDKIISGPNPALNNQTVTKTRKRFLKPLRPIARRVVNFLSPRPKPLQVKVSVSDGFYENLECDVIHFPYQDFVHCALPSIYNPHDLQHLHFPKFFAPEEIQRREIIYPAACRAADTVVVASEFVKRDVNEKYGINENKVQVIPWSPPQNSLTEINETDIHLLWEKRERPEGAFALYPAMTWEHKNHIRLLEAVARLRDNENMIVNIVCTGHKNAFWSQIEKRLCELKLQTQVKFLGVVTTKELSCLYKEAEFVIIPTLFEAASAPLFEAWQHGVAVACSSVTSLPEQAADAALLFNPYSVEDIADAIKRIKTNESLRRELRQKGEKRLRDFDLNRTLKSYRAVYRKAAGFALTDEDRYLLGDNIWNQAG